MVDADKSIWSRWEIVLLVFIIIVALVIAGGYASYALMFTKQAPADSTLVVRTGDTVSVEYIGMFEDGTVFDTSIRSVAENHTMYPKSLSFTPKGYYSPLNFTVGSGQMISGFDNGVIGMALNQTKVLTLTPNQAYGSADESLIKSMNLKESIPVFEWFGNVADFIDTFQINPDVGVNVKNIQYGWNMTVYHVDMLSDKVFVRNNPFIGEVINSVYGWKSRVVSIDSSVNSGTGEIIIQHIISNDDVGSKYFQDEMGNNFKIVSINRAEDTITVDFNRDVVGRTLVFKVTLVSLTPAP